MGKPGDSHPHSYFLSHLLSIWAFISVSLCIFCIVAHFSCFPWPPSILRFLCTMYTAENSSQDPLRTTFSFLYPPLSDYHLCPNLETLIGLVHLPVDEPPLCPMPVQSAIIKEAESCKTNMASWTDSFNKSLCWGLVARGGAWVGRTFKTNLLSTEIDQQSRQQMSHPCGHCRREEGHLDLRIRWECMHLKPWWTGQPCPNHMPSLHQYYWYYF